MCHAPIFSFTTAMFPPIRRAVTLTCSLAFVLPVSPPPTAMAFSSGRLRLRDMMTVGAVLNLTGMLVVLCFSAIVGDRLFGLAPQAEWASAKRQV